MPDPYQEIRRRERLDRDFNLRVQVAETEVEIDSMVDEYMGRKTPSRPYVITPTGRRRYFDPPPVQNFPFKKGRTKMLDTLKTLTVAKYNLEELISLRAEARAMVQEYEAQTLQVPEWLKNAATTLDSEIKLRARDEKLRRLNEVKARRAALATPEEKRAGLDSEIAALEESLK